MLNKIIQLQHLNQYPPSFNLKLKKYQRIDFIWWRRRGVLHRTLPRREKHDAGVPTADHHIQCGG